jgi:hypothetical protein
MKECLAFPDLVGEAQRYSKQYARWLDVMVDAGRCRKHLNVSTVAMTVEFIVSRARD